MRRQRGASRPRRRWSIETIVDELQRLHREGHLRMTATDLISHGHTGLASAIHKYIGSFDRARELARIPHPGVLQPEVRERWDEQRVLAEIRARDRAGE